MTEPGTWAGGAGQRAGRDADGNALVPGYNADRIDVAAGLAEARKAGYDSQLTQMAAEYALRRHARGEEEGAQRTALSQGICLTSWYRILAAARAAGEAAAQAPGLPQADPWQQSVEICEKLLAEISLMLHRLRAASAGHPVTSRCECGGLAAHQAQCRWRQGYGSRVITEGNTE